MKKLKIITQVSLLLVVLASIVAAAGISSPYWEEHPLFMHYGETKVIEFNLQNRVGEGDINVKVELLEGSDIASLEKDTYFAEFGSYDNMIPVTITIPDNYDRKTQKVTIEVKTVSDPEAGMVTLGQGWKNSFDVIIDEKPIPQESYIGAIVALIVIILLLALIILVILIRKKK